MFPFSEMPGMEVPPGFENAIMHARLVAGEAIILGSDAPPQMYNNPTGQYVSLHIEKPADADRIFGAFADGGQVQMPIDKTFWAERFGMVVDRFGTPWMINCEGNVRAEAGNN